jgi:CrcB protein
VKPIPILLVGLGGAAGAIARYVVGVLITTRTGNDWPWGTFAINVSGCFIIGLFLAWATGRDGVDAWRYLFPIGFVGAYTTFSTYAYETVRLVESGHHGRAASYVLASTLVGYAAVWAAIAIGKRI